MHALVTCYYLVNLSRFSCSNISGVCCSCKIQLEEEEASDSFDVDVAVTNPEKVG